MTAPKMWQIPEEFAALLGLYSWLKPMSVLEVGTYQGGTLASWIALAQTNATIVSVDVNPAPKVFQVPPFRAVEYTHIQGDSITRKTYEKVHALGPFDFVFIDGGHDYETVRSDWLRYGMFAGKCCAFHDIAEHDDETIEVRRLWLELRELAGERNRRTMEFVTDPPAGWGGIGVILP